MKYCVNCLGKFPDDTPFDLGNCPKCLALRNGERMTAENQSSEVIVTCYLCGQKNYLKAMRQTLDSKYVCASGCQPELTESELRRALIRQQRGAEYGETYRNFRTLGQQITALLEQHYQIDLPHPVPASIAALIMVSIKTNRLSRPCASQDSFDDAVNYIDIVEECRTHERLETEAKNTVGGGGEGNRAAPSGEPTATRA